MLNTSLQCLELAHVCCNTHESQICFVTQHGDRHNADAIVFRSFHRVHQRFAVEIRKGLAEQVDDRKANRGDIGSLMFLTYLFASSSDDC